ncbi:peptide ABC transporter substrate-binding protein [Aquibacillus kalidii]|uniref:peptide ABC transporter substrate-binding protein n=1 Tax=Aquibacillus kalidii TaxID=2762597 RepID=UPI00164877E5|nr:peptide ABC transporter substrate-binding protein [Aquibacillus kalidii]
MKKAKWSLLFVLLLAMGMFLAACGGEDSKDQDEQKSDDTASSNELAEEQVVKMTATADIPTLNSTDMQDSTSGTWAAHLFEGLMKFDENDQPIPAMAASEAEVSEDGTVFTFTIRDDANWSDGTPVTAEDFVYAWRKDNNPDTMGIYSFIFTVAQIKNAAQIQAGEAEVDTLGVEAVDEKTLKITLEKAVPTDLFHSLMAFYPFLPQPHEYAAEQGDKWATEPENTLSNGAFILDSWEHGASWTLVKNDDYFGAEDVKIEEIKVNVVKEMSTGVNLYKRDEIDYKSLASDYVPEFKDSDEFHTLTGAGMFALGYNQKNPDLANVNIRKALSYGFDKQQLTDVIWNDGSIPANGWVPTDFAVGPNGTDFREAAGDYQGFDAAKAKEFWDKGLEELGKDSITLELLTGDSDQADTQAVYLKSQLEENLPGLTLNINKQPWGQRLELTNSGDYDINTRGWSPDYADPMTFLDMYTSESTMNQQDWKNEEYDKLIEEANNLGNDPEARWEKLVEAEHILIDEEQVIGTLYQEGGVYVQKPWLKGVQHHNLGAEVDFTKAYITKH